MPIAAYLCAPGGPVRSRPGRPVLWASSGPFAGMLDATLWVVENDWLMVLHTLVSSGCLWGLQFDTPRINDQWRISGQISGESLASWLVISH